jgi:hypothetical protein
MTTVEPHTATPRRQPLKPRPAPGVRRFGYLVAAAVNAVLLYLVNARPGWDAVPFLTDDTTLVLGAVNASITAGLVTNLVYAVADPRRLRAFGDAVTTAVGLYALVRVWQVFPFDVADGWTTVLRVLLVVGIAGSGVAIVSALVRLATGR